MAMDDSATPEVMAACQRACFQMLPFLTRTKIKLDYYIYYMKEFFRDIKKGNG